MTLQDFEAFTNQKGFSRIGCIAYGTEGDYPVLIQYLTSSQWRITFTANIAQPVALQSRMAMLFPKRTVSKILCKPDSVAFTLCFHGENPLELYQYALSIVMSALSASGVVPLTFCPFCGQDGCDSLCVVQDRYAPVHETCASRAYPPAVLPNESAAPSSGNLITGLIGAVLGLLVGCLPQFALNLVSGYSLAALYLLPALFAFGGYKLFRGSDSSIGRTLCVVLSILFAPCVTILCAVASIMNSMGFSMNVSFALLPIGLEDVQFATAVALELFYSFLFSVVGCIVGWKVFLSVRHIPTETFRAHLATLRRYSDTRYQQAQPSYKESPSHEEENF
mgnify:CR=1 FL=1